MRRWSGASTSMHRKNIRALSLIVCTFTYLMMGAAVFDALESEADMRRRHELDRLRDRLVAKYKFSAKDLRLLETVVVRSIPHKAGYQWRFGGAFYFATLVITTVGYGHSTPATLPGKAFCMIFAGAGIPLGLVMFQSIGERLNTFISFLLKRCRKSLGIERFYEISPSHLIFISSTLGTAVIALGTYMFQRNEDWGLFASFYYCFITLTTIGFGDYVALQRDGRLQDSPGYVMFSLLFILFGLAVFSACVNLFVLRFMATNTDADGGDYEPPKTVLLETLAASDTPTPNGSIILRDMSPMPRRPGALFSRSRAQTTGLAGALRRCHCRRRPSRLFAPTHYTVRRSPTPCIGHLLDDDADDADVYADAVLLHHMRKRRISD